MWASLAWSRAAMPASKSPERREIMKAYGADIELVEGDGSYVYDDNGTVDGESCPECGDAYLADHGDRRHCGRCGYTEWL